MSKILIIPEKPSVAQDIAAALGGFSKREDWFERDDAIVCSALGHLVELACPEAEDPGFDLARLPAIPSCFNLAPIAKTSARLSLLKKLMNRQDVQQVVNACDAGREGELIFRYIYLCCGCRKPMQRMWIQSMTPAAIKEAFAKRRPGAELDGLFNSAQSRSEGDWLVGINGTRAYSILETRSTGERTLSTVGRVQTPTLALIVAREEAIRSFIAKPYYEIQGEFSAKAGVYGAKWIDTAFQADSRTPDARAERLFDKAKADAIVAKCTGKRPSSVADATTDSISTPPKLFDLTTLQREANKKFGFSASQTLAIAQALYEKQKVLTYPRTDSSALPEDYLDTARATLTRLGDGGLTVSPFAAKAVAMVKPDKRIFNNAKISDHFAIIPTGLVSATLSGEEAKIFDLVSRRFIAAFFPPAKYLQTVRLTVVEQETFRASGRVLVEEGWLAVYGKEADDSEDPALCAVAKDELPENRRIEAVSLKTKPPLRFTEATLLGAMESAGADIEDDELREAMKDRGLGTPATRASTIEALLADKDGKGRSIQPYVVREKKNLAPTNKAFKLVKFLRENGLTALASAETTGLWEFKLREMEKGRCQRSDFMGEIAALAREFVTRVQALAKDLPASAAMQAKPMAAACPKCGNTTMGATAKTFSCSCGFRIWREVAGRVLSDTEGEKLIAQGSLPTLAGFTSSKKKPFAAGLKLAEDLSGKVDFVFEQHTESSEAAAVACPQCGKPMRRRKGGTGFFWGCSGYPDCNHTMDDKDGKAVPKQPKVARQAGKVGETCPTCQKGKLTGRQSNGTSFLGCTKYPACRHYERV